MSASAIGTSRSWPTPKPASTSANASPRRRVNQYVTATEAATPDAPPNPSDAITP
jgi:hypothetical protein